MLPEEDKIGGRIRRLRKSEKLTQVEFARRLGVHGGYISTLETHGNEPSEQLILNICRTFEADYKWLKFGIGKQYDPKSSYHLTRFAKIKEEIHRRIDAHDRNFALSEIARLLGVDPADPSKKFSLPEEFHDAISMVMRIFEEGSPKKIQAMMSFLRAFMPEFDLKGFKKGIKEQFKKEQDEYDKFIRERSNKRKE
jgi:transcriptional regulator with XRE-family HTH domain